MSTCRRVFQTTPLPSGYAPLLADLKARVRAAQVGAVLSVNRGNENGADWFFKVGEKETKGDANLFLCPPNDLM